jgi:Tol biopolymer transport system component
MDLGSRLFTKLVQVDRQIGALEALSPDDTTAYLLYSSDGSGLTVNALTRVTRSSYTGVVAVDLTNGRRRDVVMVGDGSTVNSVALSPDGRTIAMFVYGQQATRLVTLGVDGSRQKDIYVSSKPIANLPDHIQWQADGRSLLFIENGRVMRIGSQGGTPEFTGLAMRRPDRGHPIALSPDGSRIAFSDGAPWSEAREVWALDNVLTVVTATP